MNEQREPGIVTISICSNVPKLNFGNINLSGIHYLIKEKSNF